MVGVEVFGGNLNSIRGNYVGLAANGSSGIPNSAGVFLWGSARSNTVGGATSGARNVISANSEGVRLESAGTAYNVVVGNYIGTDATGTQARGNSGSGVLLQYGAHTNRIGGVSAGEGNLIAANYEAITINGITNTVVQGNAIGVNVNGAPLGNTAIAIDLGSASSH